MTTAELIKERINLLKQMHQYIVDIGDEDIYDAWVTDGIPDEPSEEDYEFIAKYDREWTNVCREFGQLILIDSYC